MQFSVKVRSAWRLIIIVLQILKARPALSRAAQYLSVVSVAVIVSVVSVAVIVSVMSVAVILRVNVKVILIWDSQIWI